MALHTLGNFIGVLNSGLTNPLLILSKFSQLISQPFKKFPKANLLCLLVSLSIMNTKEARKMDLRSDHQDLDIYLYKGLTLQ